MTAGPTQPLSLLDLLTEPERRQILVDWNDTAADYPADRCLHHLVEEQAERTPGAAAVVHGADTLTYAELDGRANQMAHRLRSLGVGPDVLVGLCVERDVAMVVGLLGILKAGGAYVPLDPEYPRQRLDFMLEDSGVAVLVTQQAMLERLPATGARVLCLDRDGDDIKAEPSRPPGPVGVEPDDLAYVIYTSGSTGRPKGVMGTHRAAVCRLAWARSDLPFGDGEVACQKTSLSFVDSVGELFRPLTAGVPLVIISSEAVGDPCRLAGILEDNHVSRIVLVPSLLRALLDEVDHFGRRMPLLHTWIVSGEVLASSLAARFLASRPASRLLNLYGSSEVAADATWHAVRHADPSVPVPIGRPLQNTRLYILDDHGRPVPAGVVGELHVGGPGLARGYLGRPALTAERFVPDPFSDDPAARLYRTGDLGRWSPDGTIEFGGRRDHQVKVRGFRIELGEVEAALAAQPEISAVVVGAREDRSGDTTLVAYLVPDGEQPNTSELRRRLLGALPSHMVPAAFVTLEALPLTPSGKVDRSALPAPDDKRPELASSYVAPRTPVEQALAGIWAEVLGIRRVGVDDSFFDLGGHSLLSVQAVALVRERLGVDLALRTLFQSPTVGGVAAALASALGGGSGDAGAGPPPLRRQAASRAPLSLSQNQLWLLEGWGEPGAYNETIRHRLLGPVDLGALRRALAWLVDRHEPLRTTFPVKAGEPYQSIAPGLAVEPVVTDLTSLPACDREDELYRLVAVANRAPFDVATGPVFRARLFTLGDEAEVALTLDHLICDDTSLHMLASELAAGYDAFAAGGQPTLAALSLQYADFAAWQRQWLTPDRLAAKCRYWVETLKDAPLVINLPYDRPPAGPADLYTMSTPPRVYEFAIAGEVRSGLIAFGRKSASTPFIVCMAAVVALLGRYDNGDDVVVATLLSGRDRPELEGVLGYIVDLAWLRADLSGDPPFATLVDRVRDAMLGMMENQQVPALQVMAALRDQGVDLQQAMHPVDVQFFHAAHDHWRPGTAVVARPPAQDAHRDEEFPEASKPLCFRFYDDGEQLWGAIRYRVDLFDPPTVELVASDLVGLLADVATDPGRRLSDLSRGPRSASVGG